MAHPEQVSATAFSGNPQMQMKRVVTRAGKTRKGMLGTAKNCHKRDCQLIQDLNLLWLVCTAAISVSAQ